uniref:Uncharacterized protein n=1 Tax=Seriola dumerili TaxID=41447 RepID=A0A3B4V7A9_SERDU
IEGRESHILHVFLTMIQSGLSMSFSRWQELVVTELAPAHHSRENSQRSLTTHRLTVIFLLRRFLPDTDTMKENVELRIGYTHCVSACYTHNTVHAP